MSPVREWRSPPSSTSLPNCRNFEVHIHAAAEGVAVPERNENAESRSCLLVGASFCQWQRASRKSYTAASEGPKPETITATKTMNQTTRPMNECPPNTAIDGGVVTLITTVEQIVMCVKSAETEDVDFCHCHEWGLCTGHAKIRASPHCVCNTRCTYRFARYLLSPGRRNESVRCGSLYVTIRSRAQSALFEGAADASASQRNEKQPFGSWQLFPLYFDKGSSNTYCKPVNVIPLERIVQNSCLLYRVVLRYRSKY
jgi:hypothetical protein